MKCKYKFMIKLTDLSLKPPSILSCLNPWINIYIYYNYIICILVVINFLFTLFNYFIYLFILFGCGCLAIYVLCFACCCDNSEW